MASQDTKRRQGFPLLGPHLRIHIFSRKRNTRFDESKNAGRERTGIKEGSVRGIGRKLSEIDSPKEAKERQATKQKED